MAVGQTLLGWTKHKPAGRPIEGQNVEQINSCIKDGNGEEIKSLSLSFFIINPDCIHHSASIGYLRSMPL